ncbi:unnamed protein product [Lactuca saligna]|uniref:Uncharacterized protein n=1 Tax=Lactuca saligna TaxID=75948 RepID=A0AA35ZXA4_LACSI|nr:unnamed protein product [Lactuca saligna]
MLGVVQGWKCPPQMVDFISSLGWSANNESFGKVDFTSSKYTILSYMLPIKAAELCLSFIFKFIQRRIKYRCLLLQQSILLQDEATGSDTEKNIYALKVKELLNCLHEVGTLPQITSIQGEQVVLISHRRLRITEMVSEDPLTVQVDHIKDLPYSKDDDVQGRMP